MHLQQDRTPPSTQPVGLPKSGKVGQQTQRRVRTTKPPSPRNDHGLETRPRRGWILSGNDPEGAHQSHSARTLRTSPHPLTHQEWCRYQWPCLESGFTSRKPSRQYLLLKRDGPCDIHLLHHKVTRQSVSRSHRIVDVTATEAPLRTCAHTHTHTPLPEDS